MAEGLDVAPATAYNALLATTNALARKAYDAMGYEVALGHRFDLGRHPQEREAWLKACAQIQARWGVDPEYALRLPAHVSVGVIYSGSSVSSQAGAIGPRKIKLVAPHDVP